MNEQVRRKTVFHAAPLPAELEARVQAFENAAAIRAFDIRAWLYMIALGVALPVALLFIGWWV